jgi:SAM-dependent methyltransferase
VAESLPLDDGSAEAIFVAEAFHWFDGQRALAEASRVLTEGGLLVLLWDVPVGPWEPDIGDDVRNLVRAAICSGGEPGEARYVRGEWRRAFERSAFEPLEEQQIEYVFESSQDGLIANILSTSSIAGLPEAERQALRDELRQRLAHNIYRQRLRVDIYRTTLRGGPSRDHSIDGGDDDRIHVEKEPDCPPVDRFHAASRSDRCRSCWRGRRISVRPYCSGMRSRKHGDAATRSWRPGPRARSAACRLLD